MSNENLDKLKALEDDFDNAFLALIEHTGASGFRDEIIVNGKLYSLIIEGEDIQPKSILARLKSLFKIYIHQAEK